MFPWFYILFIVLNLVNIKQVLFSRLSERNCIEIVQKLNELKLIDILYTTDGKEYLTPVELGKEILEELVVNGGNYIARVYIDIFILQTMNHVIKALKCFIYTCIFK